MKDKPIFALIDQERYISEKYPNRKYSLVLTRDKKYWTSSESLSMEDLRIIRNTIRVFMRDYKRKLKNQKK